MLNREPMVMKGPEHWSEVGLDFRVSVLNREPMVMKDTGAAQRQRDGVVSVLNREPMVMKAGRLGADAAAIDAVSVLNREPMVMKGVNGDLGQHLPVAFQCSTASRW